MSYLEDREDEEWEHDDLLLAKDIHDSDDYDLMEEFCLSMENPQIKDKLLCAIQEKGAFGRFRTALHCFTIEKIWDNYRHEHLKNLAVDWCQSQGFAYKYKLPPYLTTK